MADRLTVVTLIVSGTVVLAAAVLKARLSKVVPPLIAVMLRLVVPASREPDTILRAIVDTEATERFPIYTRGNADEVGPDPFTPLNWTLTWEQGIVPGTARHAHRGAPEANRRRFHQIDHLCVELDRFEAGQRP